MVDSTRDTEDSWDSLDSDPSKSSFTEAAKKLLAFGVSAAFVTEETLKHLVKDLKLPRDVIQGLLKGAGKSKQEMLDKISNEVVRMISKIDFVKEASRFVETHKFQISAEVSISRKDTGQKELAVSTKLSSEDSDPHIEVK